MATENYNVNLNFNADTASILSMKQQLRELNIALQEAEKAGDNVTFDKLSMKIGELRNDMIDMKEKMRYMDPGEFLAGTVKLTQGIIGSFGAITGMMELFGSKNEMIQEIEKKSIVIIQVLTSLESARQLLEGKGLVAGLAGQTKRLAMQAAIKLGLISEIALTEAATAETLKFNAALLANPAVLITAGILALGAAIYYLTQETDRFAESNKILTEYTKKTQEEIKGLDKSIYDLGLQYDVLNDKITQNSAEKLKIQKDFREKLYNEAIDYADKINKIEQDENLFYAEKQDQKEKITLEYNKKKEKLYEEYRLKIDVIDEKIEEDDKNRLISKIKSEVEHYEKLIVLRQNYVSKLIDLEIEYDSFILQKIKDNEEFTIDYQDKILKSEELLVEKRIRKLELLNKFEMESNNSKILMNQKLIKNLSNSLDELDIQTVESLKRENSYLQERNKNILESREAESKKTQELINLEMKKLSISEIVYKKALTNKKEYIDLLNKEFSFLQGNLAFNDLIVQKEKESLDIKTKSYDSVLKGIQVRSQEIRELATEESEKSYKSQIESIKKLTISEVEKQELIKKADQESIQRLQNINLFATKYIEEQINLYNDELLTSMNKYYDSLSKQQDEIYEKSKDILDKRVENLDKLGDKELEITLLISNKTIDLYKKSFKEIYESKVKLEKDTLAVELDTLNKREANLLELNKKEEENAEANLLELNKKEEENAILSMKNMDELAGIQERYSVREAQIKNVISNEKIKLEQQTADKISLINEDLYRQLEKIEQKRRERNVQIIEYAELLSTTLLDINAERLEQELSDEEYYAEKRNEIHQTELDDKYAADKKYIEDTVKDEEEKKRKLYELDVKKKNDDKKLAEEVYRQDLKLRQQRFKSEQSQAISEIAIQTAIAVAKAIAQNPMGFGLPGSAFALAQGIAQTAVVALRKPPMYRLGGLFTGARHEQGGINANLEDGEVVLNRRSMANPVLRNLASQINVAGGGVPIPQTSNSMSNVGASSITIDDAALERIVKSVASIPVVVSEPDITKTQRRVSVIEQKSTY